MTSKKVYGCYELPFFICIHLCQSSPLICPSHVFTCAECHSMRVRCSWVERVPSSLSLSVCDVAEQQPWSSLAGYPGSAAAVPLPTPLPPPTPWAPLRGRLAARPGLPLAAPSSACCQTPGDSCASRRCRRSISSAPLCLFRGGGGGTLRI